MKDRSEGEEFAVGGREEAAAALLGNASGARKKNKRQARNRCALSGEDGAAALVRVRDRVSCPRNLTILTVRSKNEP